MLLQAQSGFLSCADIPAWAGNAANCALCVTARPVHPRVGGERRRVKSPSRPTFGSSPRGRGTLFFALFGLRSRRFIPAWAGNALSKSVSKLGITVHPRVGGERGSCVGSRMSQTGSSPRGRGTPCSSRSNTVRRRFIPAWAGNADVSNGWHPRRAVHPRVGGERSHSLFMSVRLCGSSPRGRGTLLL